MKFYKIIEDLMHIFSYINSLIPSIKFISTISHYTGLNILSEYLPQILMSKYLNNFPTDKKMGCSLHIFQQVLLIISVGFCCC